MKFTRFSYIYHINILHSHQGFSLPA